jgi:hypothetical protein
MFSLAELCSDYLKIWILDESALDTDLVINISKKIFNGNHEPFEEYRVEIENTELNIMDAELILTLLKGNPGKFDGVASIPIFYYVAAIYDNWTVEKLRIAIDEIENDLKRSYSMLHFKTGIIEPYFLKTLELFNKSLTDDVALFIKLR